MITYNAGNLIMIGSFNLNAGYTGKITFGDVSLANPITTEGTIGFVLKVLTAGKVTFCKLFCEINDFNKVGYFLNLQNYSFASLITVDANDNIYFSSTSNKTFYFDGVIRPTNYVVISSNAPLSSVVVKLNPSGAFVNLLSSTGSLLAYKLLYNPVANSIFFAGVGFTGDKGIKLGNGALISDLNTSGFYFASFNTNLVLNSQVLTKGDADGMYDNFNITLANNGDSTILAFNYRYPLVIGASTYDIPGK